MLRCSLIMGLAFALVGWFGSWARTMKAGTEAYWHGNYDAALDAFQQATLQKPDNAIARHNLGTALYKKRRFKAAATAFQESILTGNVPDEAAAYYNLGNSQFQMGDLGSAIESYKHSLRLNPQDADAQHNLELALQLMKNRQENATQQQADKNAAQQQEPTKTEPSNISEAEALRLLERLSKNENKLRQKLLQQQRKSEYRREKDW